MLKVNNTEIENVIFNGIEIDTLIFNGVTVFERNKFNPEEILIDFYYVDNGNGTYSITGWKQTYQGVSSTKCVIPDYPQIIL
jgi:hypothetical protein